MTAKKAYITVGPYNPDDVPDGWLPCDGSEVSKTAYAELFGATEPPTVPAAEIYMPPLFIFSIFDMHAGIVVDIFQARDNEEALSIFREKLRKCTRKLDVDLRKVGKIDRTKGNITACEPIHIINGQAIIFTL